MGVERDQVYRRHLDSCANLQCLSTLAEDGESRYFPGVTRGTGLDRAELSGSNLQEGSGDPL